VYVNAATEELSFRSSFGSFDARTVGDTLDDGPWRRSRSARSDAHGRFRIPGLAPGTYWIGERQVEVESGGPPIELTIARPAPETAIRGIVVDGRGERIGGAIVSAGELVTRTDSYGRFALEEPGAGRHDLDVAHESAGIATGPVFEPAVVRGVAAGTDDLVVRVSRGPALRGRVLRADGAPASGARVVVLPAEPPEGRAQRPVTAGDRTDPDGRYELRGVPGGRFEVAVFCDAHLPLVFTAEPGDGPGVRLSPGATIDGVVLAPDGTPASGWTVKAKLVAAARPEEVDPWRCDGQRYGPWFDARTDAEGAFRFAGLPAGEYTIDLGNRSGVAPARVRAGAAGLSFRLRALGAVVGVVVGPDGRPVSRSGLARLKVSAHAPGGQVGYVAVAEDGTFRFDGVPGGRTRLHVIGWEEFESAEVFVDAPVRDVRIRMEPSGLR
jgi:hypothetical protein